MVLEEGARGHTCSQWCVWELGNRLSCWCYARRHTATDAVSFTPLRFLPSIVFPLTFEHFNLDRTFINQRRKTCLEFLKCAFCRGIASFEKHLASLEVATTSLTVLTNSPLALNCFLPFCHLSLNVPQNCFIFVVFVYSRSPSMWCFIYGCLLLLRTFCLIFMIHKENKSFTRESWLLSFYSFVLLFLLFNSEGTCFVSYLILLKRMWTIKFLQWKDVEMHRPSFFVSLEQRPRSWSRASEMSVSV